MHRVILWFRNDLRLHDNACLELAQSMAKSDPFCEIVPVFCFDKRFLEAQVTKYAT